MKQLFLILCLIFTSVYSTLAQNSLELGGKNFIEVTGTSETEVTPDEIYVTITLLERMDGKDKVTIEKQEGDLKKNIKELGLDLNDLTLNSADADYGKVRRSTKDVLVKKSYLLKVSNADMLSKVYERLDKINANDAFISRYSHSKILDLQKENRIKAVKAAKEKIDYLLAAVGQQAGKPIEIKEHENYVQNAPVPMYANAMSMRSEKLSEDSDSQIGFKKIKIRSSFLVKYEILNK
ncbi:SIMPL domain-containing protein [Aurantibacillus circumpalustris]|uniref:SIMPL domain-containing protein n=1 Tax=Aurantibacillus circumpalustris TaxID=3036359 RepID=UPI00295ABA14|nr:SIMPL domain-containing protein [Aurantibacillus circumpalustris]